LLIVFNGKAKEHARGSKFSIFLLKIEF